MSSAIPRWTHAVACLMALVGSTAPPALAAPDTAAAAFRHADNLLAQNPDAPPLPGRPSGEFYDLCDARDAYLALAARGSDPARAYRGAAEAERRLGHYDQAAALLRRAMKAAPADHRAEQDLARLQPLLDARAAIRKVLPATRTITRLRLYPVGGTRYWAVLHGRAGEKLEGLTQPSGMRLSLFTAPPSIRQVGPDIPLVDARREGVAQDYRGVECCAIDMTGDGVPELAVHELSYGGSWKPSQMEVYAWRNGRLARILQVQSSLPVCLEDIDHNGTYQVRNRYEIGGDMCHAEQPRWSDVYAYRNGRFVIANRSYPRAFAEWPDELRKKLRKYPGDPEIRAYLCLAYELTGQNKRATPLRKRAAAWFRSELATDSEQNRLAPGVFKATMREHLAVVRGKR